jgi:hypothetical protein
MNRNCVRWGGGVCTALGMLMLGCVGGCGSARVTQPLPEKLYANDADSQLEFWHSLASRKLASNNEAFHGMLLYFDGQDPANSYEERVKLLKGRKLLAADFNRPADEAVTRGTMSVSIVKALHIKGGLMMHITGPNPRYATRELQYEGLYPPSSPNQIFSGTEFVGIIGKLDDYQHGNPAPVTGRATE